jgi:hypothetical protein
MRDLDDLSAAERTVGYHNPEDGEGRLKALKKVLAPALRRR